MSHKRNTFKVFGSMAALSVMVFSLLGSCQDALDSDLSPEVAGALSRSTASVQVNMGDIEGEWYSSDYGETFDITDTTLTYGIASWGNVFAGTIEAVTDPTATEGYIYIEYTDALEPNWVGNIYVVKWSYLNTSVTPNTVRLSGCSDGEGKGSVAEAESAYVTNPDKEYFAGYSVCERVTSGYTKAAPSLSGKPPLLLLLEQQSGVTLEFEDD
jgi:hypothetical protein